MHSPITRCHYLPRSFLGDFYPYIGGVCGKNVLVVGCKASLIGRCIRPHEDFADKGVGERAEFAGDDGGEVCGCCCAGEDEGAAAGGVCRRHVLLFKTVRWMEFVVLLFSQATRDCKGEGMR